MSESFVQQLRARGEPIRLAGDGGDILNLRVEVPEVWDVVGVQASPSDPVQLIKVHALERLQSGGRAQDEYVVKFRGWEVRDETASLQDIGVRDGSTLLLTQRRRRPVKR